MKENDLNSPFNLFEQFLSFIKMPFNEGFKGGKDL